MLQVENRQNPQSYQLYKQGIDKLLASSHRKLSRAGFFYSSESSQTHPLRPHSNLPPTDYPKLIFYNFMIYVYLLLSLSWFYLCWKNRKDLLPIQNYVSGTIVFLVIEMIVIRGE
jgi:hypothetical protein